jgi:hypothetical protein
MGIFTAIARADVAVLTQHNGLSHTGANLQETILNTNKANTKTFEFVFTRTVDDQIYSQPLIIPTWIAFHDEIRLINFLNGVRCLHEGNGGRVYTSGPPTNFEITASNMRLPSSSKLKM